MLTIGLFLLVFSLLLLPDVPASFLDGIALRGPRSVGAVCSWSVDFFLLSFQIVSVVGYPGL